MVTVRFSSLDLLLFLCQNMNIDSIANHVGCPERDSSLKGDIWYGYQWKWQ